MRIPSIYLYVFAACSNLLSFTKIDGHIETIKIGVDSNLALQFLLDYVLI